MNIQIQHVSGDISCFDMKNEQSCMDLISSIKPSEFFDQSLLRIQTGRRTYIFNINAIESIYFSTFQKLKTREQLGVRDLKTISETEYRKTLDTLQSQYETLGNLFEPGLCIKTLITLHCVSGKKHFLQVDVIPGLRVEQLMDLQNRLGRLTSVIPCSPEGYIAINPSAIERIEIYPAPQETTLTAWLVD